MLNVFYSILSTINAFRLTKDNQLKLFLNNFMRCGILSVVFTYNQRGSVPNVLITIFFKSFKYIENGYYLNSSSLKPIK